MAYVPLEKLHALEDGYRRRLLLRGRELLLLQEEGRCYLLHNRCPHAQAPLDRASVDRGVLRCPAHGMEFDLRTGHPLRGVCAPLSFVPLIYEGNTLGVELPD